MPRKSAKDPFSHRSWKTGGQIDAQVLESHSPLLKTTFQRFPTAPSFSQIHVLAYYGSLTSAHQTLTVYGPAVRITAGDQCFPTFPQLLANTTSWTSHERSLT